MSRSARSQTLSVLAALQITGLGGNSRSRPSAVPRWAGARQQEANTRKQAAGSKPDD
jgi:hypothetical protein